MMKRRKWALHEGAGADGAAAGGGGGGGAGGDGAAASSALAAGADGAGAGGGGEGAGAPAFSFDAIPEKYRVTKADGTPDLEASFVKTLGGYEHLSKRLGGGEAPPKEVGEYQISMPEALKGKLDLSKDAKFGAWLDGAHKAGLTQAQLDHVMGGFFSMVPSIANGAHDATIESTQSALKEHWKTDADYKRGIGRAFKTAGIVADKLGMQFADLEKAGLGNNPTFIRLMDALHDEFMEDSSPGGGNPGGNQESIEQLMAHPAYTDRKHPEHEAISKRVKAYFERKHGSAAAL